MSFAFVKELMTIQNYSQCHSCMQEAVAYIHIIYWKFAVWYDVMCDVCNVMSPDIYSILRHDMLQNLNFKICLICSVGYVQANISQSW